MLEEGNIKISYDKFIYHINIKIMDSNNIIDCLKNIEKWMLKNGQDNEFFISLKQILPESDIEPVEKIPYRHKILKIFDPDYFQYIFWITLALIILFLRPELFEKLIGTMP